MVEDVELIGDGHACAFKLGNRSRDVVILHVAGRIVVGANRKNARVLTVRALDQKCKSS